MEIHIDDREINTTITNKEIRGAIRKGVEFISTQPTEIQRGMYGIETTLRSIGIRVIKAKDRYLVEIGVHDWSGEAEPRLVGYKVYSEQYMCGRKT